MTPLPTPDKRIERDTESVAASGGRVHSLAARESDESAAPIRPPVKSFDWFQSDERRAWP